LETARLSLAKLQEPADALTLLQAENTLVRAQESKKQTEDDLKKSYESAYNDVSDAFLKLPDIMTGLHDILFTNSLNDSQDNINFYADSVSRYDAAVDAYKSETQVRYDNARKAYDQNFVDYKATNRFSDVATIEKLLEQTYQTNKLLSDATKSANNLIQFYQDTLTQRLLKPATLSNTHLTNLADYAGQINSILSALFADQNAIQNDKNSIIDAQRTIDEKTGSLAKLKEPPDPLDIRSQELTIQQRQQALQDAKDNLAYFTVRAPIDGVAAAVNVQKGDPASTGTIVVSLITTKQMAEISLNEVDVAKIKVGQKATLSLDAVPDLEITGVVSQIDSLGTVSQGVVTYDVKIGFDTQDDRIKPGMSVSASIITEVRPDVLTVPNSAVKSANGANYVLMLDNVPAGETSMTTTAAARRQAVQTGLADETQTEITGGLNEGDMVVTKSTTGAATNGASSSTTQNRGGVGIPGVGGGIRLPGVGGGRPD
jgi:RND family efflux transporter MFP subunit